MAGGNVPANLAPTFVQAGHQFKIPPQVLAGVASVESTFRNGLTSPTGAQGLMQFEPSTAAGVGLTNPWDEKASIFAAAKLLNQYGYQQNPLRALGAYNGGPNNPQYAYANQVMAEARRLAPQLKGVGGISGTTVNAPQQSGAGGASPQQIPLVGPKTASTSFLQHGVPQPTPASILGSYLANEPKINPWGDKTTSPLVTSGLLPTQVQTVTPVTKVTLKTPPSPMQQTFLKAQNSLQTLAGTSTLNVHPGTGPAGQKVSAMTQMAKRLIGKPYVWGGGHGGWGIQSGYDCSGFVSAVLHAAGYLSAPQTTQTLPSQPGIQNGPGRFVTIYDRTNASPSEDHVIININGSWFESGGNAATGGGGGVKHIPKPPGSYLSSFNRTLHPQGL